jgi:putative endonuclease
MRFRACAVYILSNLNRTVLYTGVTNDLVRRTTEHRQRMNPDGFAERYRADRLVYYEPFEGMVAAIRREKRIKGWSRAKKRELISRANPDWRDLWSSVCQ